jgi:hypothetical protein
MMMPLTSWYPLDRPKPIAAKPRVFVSYHHRGDQYWYNQFSTSFGSIYDVICDRSLERRIESEDPRYVDRRIRERFIVGTSLTIVLCGRDSWKRKYVDWEIYATLYCRHALLGIVLPTVTRYLDVSWVAPPRLLDNIRSGYAHYARWPQSPLELRAAIEEACCRSRQTWRIQNRVRKYVRNVPVRMR